MKQLVFVILSAVLLFSGCAPTSLVSSWKAADASNVSTYKKLMVVGLMGGKYLELSQKSETAIVQTLQSAGVQAISGYEIFGPREFQSLTEQEVVGKLKTEGVDAVMFIVLLDKAKEKDWISGSFYHTPYAGFYYGCYWCHYNAMRGRIYSPGYFSTTTTYILEADLYSVADNKLQYSAQIKSVDPSGVVSLSQQFSDIVLKDLAAKGLLNSDNKK